MGLNLNNAHSTREEPKGRLERRIEEEEACKAGMRQHLVHKMDIGHADRRWTLGMQTEGCGRQKL